MTISAPEPSYVTIGALKLYARTTAQSILHDDRYCRTDLLLKRYARSYRAAATKMSTKES